MSRPSIELIGGANGPASANSFRTAVRVDPMSRSVPPSAEDPKGTPIAARLSWQLEVNGVAPPEELAGLWSIDPERNPFVSPSFLRAMHLAARARGDTPVWAVGRTDTGDVAALWPLRVDCGHTLRFLALNYSDHSTCLGRPEVAERELAGGLAQAMRETEPAGIELTRIPPWSRTRGAAHEALRRVGWYHRVFSAWSCPVLRVASGSDAGRSLRDEIERHKRVRGYANALRREPGFAFEVLDDDRDLETWLSQFCAAHVRRWDGTPTPSIYKSARARTLLLAAVTGWAIDGVLLRFAIRTDAGRVAFVIGLRAGTRLVYFHVVNSPDGERTRAGHVLIRLMGLWMSERGFDTLDFGAGGEEYKTRYANCDDRLSRVFGAPSALSRTFARAVVESSIRNSPFLMRAWSALEQHRNRVRTGLRRLLSNGAMLPANAERPSPLSVDDASPGHETIASNEQARPR
jgi:CelD/BcsL family acetyltransferase involved in cellulose biosynthesis